MASVLFLAVLLIRATFSFEFKNANDGSDLNIYVSRPDLRPPIYEVTIHDPERITPGFWFVAPYEKVAPDPLTKNYQPCQIGPQIYDNGGNLVWGGGCFFQNRNAYNFRPIDNGLGSNLSVNYGSAVENDAEHRKGMGVIMSPSFNTVNTVPAPARSKDFDLHEFHVIENGKRALMLTSQPVLIDISVLGVRQKTAWVKSQGFQEVDLETGQVIFEWSALDHLNLTEGWKPLPPDPVSADAPWDVFHMNSIDKDVVSGNYMVSLRGTNTIYLISGVNGGVLWRLGYQQTSFTMLGPLGEVLEKSLPFYGQHDARFMYCSSSNVLPSCQSRRKDDGKILISVFDNGAISNSKRMEGVKSSSSVLLLLDTLSTPMTAQVLERHYRPDSTFSWTRGNAQYLKNGNVFVGWSIQGYVSEHYTDASGASKCAMEAKLKSDRFGVYRSYKFNFTSEPSEPIALVTQVHASAGAQGEPETVLSTFYVSWNGATEVVKWNFYLGNSESKSSSLPQPSDKFTLIGTSPKRGFETQFSVKGWAEWSFVEAISEDGKSLGRSEIFRTTLPQSWSGSSNRPTAAETISVKDKLDIPKNDYEEPVSVPDRVTEKAPSTSAHSAHRAAHAPKSKTSDLPDPPNKPPSLSKANDEQEADSYQWQNALKNVASSNISNSIREADRNNAKGLLLWVCFLGVVWVIFVRLRRRRN